MTRQWERDIQVAESRRYEDPSAMDILGAREMDSATNDPPPDETRLTQTGDKWLHLALLIEEQQYVVHEPIEFQ